ncbi:ABC transporter substrate-binding protein [Aestuariivirga sp. YIM B02566]|uniref:Amino acid ABC transporter substrate-binding protein n=1 Tax=Taklimakanibacter albus TaxID=2800327 RepID=A0ACC5R4Y3_9HYPH|nr:ABC transporter substrate-binding protein [Aestuariivirga sp. YIM B02566]MBK1867561.1 amino acid ABC transporter substrate-binding protein [Aestuariivirga sp. YIM B02566]
MILATRLFLAGLAFWALAATASAADKIGNCELTGAKGSARIATPAVPGQLTVAVSLPAPVWWNGDTPEAIKDGMEYCLAAEIAWRAGYDKLKVVAVDFVPLVSGEVKDYDLALSEVSITEERKKVVDFSVPYFNSDIGVLTLSASPVTQKTVRKVTVGIQQGTTGAAFALDVLKVKDYNVYAERADLLKALSDEDVVAVLTDTSITLSAETASAGKIKVVGQYKTGEIYGAVYPKGNANNPTLDKIMKAIIDDGTMKKLAAKYLVAAWGKDPGSIPYFKP